MTRPEMSIWPWSTPCRAHVGSAWWRLCQESPKLSKARGQKFVDRSRTANGLSPMRWQIELTDQVTWLWKPARTRLAQKKAARAPGHDQVSKPPIRAGAKMLTRA